MKLKVLMTLSIAVLEFLMTPLSRAEGVPAAIVLKATVAVEWTPELPRANSNTPQSAASKEKHPKENQPESGELTVTYLEPGSGRLNTTQVPADDPQRKTIGVQPRYLWATNAAAARPRKGSGVIVDPAGLIVTNLPVGSGGTFTTVLEDGRKIPAVRSVTDQRSGLLLLKVDVQNLPAVTLGLEPLNAGEPVVAGMSTEPNFRSLRRGIVTGKNRTVNGPCAELIQTDVPAWDSMTGSPLVNASGQLVGIMTHQEEVEVPGLTFAIPARFVKLLLDVGSEKDPLILRKGFLGVQLHQTGDVAPNVVLKVIADSPAAKAGIKPNDEIVQIDGMTVQSSTDVVLAISQHKAGDHVKVNHKREGKELTTEIVLSDFPQQTEESPVKVNVVQPPQILVLTPNATGDLKLTPRAVFPLPQPVSPSGNDSEKSSEGSKPNPPTPAAPHPDIAKSVSEHYARLLRGPGPAGTIRIERSDLNQKLDDLKSQVDALKTEVSKLTKVLEQVEKKLPVQP